jgi:transcriptional regulator with XRE-family HTH domain
MAMIETFGQRLVRIRTDKDLKQGELARRAGISRQLLSLYERDASIPTIVPLEWICNALDISASELLGF